LSTKPFRRYAALKAATQRPLTLRICRCAMVLMLAGGLSPPCTSVRCAFPARQHHFACGVATSSSSVCSRVRRGDDSRACRAAEQVGSPTLGLKLGDFLRRAARFRQRCILGSRRVPAIGLRCRHHNCGRVGRADKTVSRMRGACALRETFVPEHPGQEKHQIRLLPGWHSGSAAVL
jgi:hypothetical protein